MCACVFACVRVSACIQVLSILWKEFRKVVLFKNLEGTLSKGNKCMLMLGTQNLYRGLSQDICASLSYVGVVIAMED